jgi:thiol-disulfide isomerase/thioredoxin
MKNLMTLLLLFLGISSIAQIRYYTTDGENRMSEQDLMLKLSEMEEQTERLLGKKMQASYNVTAMKNIGDTLLSMVSFSLGDQLEEEYEYIDVFAPYIGEAFPSFSLSSLSGREFDSHQLRGKPTMINFWFTRCVPCVEEMPVLNELKERYQEEVNFIAITFNDAEEVRGFLEKHSFDFMHLVDAEEFIDQLGNKAYPKNLFLDKEGVLRYALGGLSYIADENGKMQMGGAEEFIEIIEELK